MSDWTGLSPQWVVSWPLSELVGCYVGCKNVEFGIGVRAIKLGAFHRGGWVWENLFGEGEGSWFRQTGCSSRHPQTRSIDEDWPLALTVFSSWFSLLHQGGITSLCFTLPPHSFSWFLTISQNVSMRGTKLYECTCTDGSLGHWR